MVLAFISDLHLGLMLGERWLAARVAQVARLGADAIVIGGDVLEGDSPTERDLLPLLGRLSAPRGVWVVAGNHEGHGGRLTMAAFQGLGFQTLEDEWRELVPGLVLAGVDGTRGRRGGGPAPTAGRPAAPFDGLRKALEGRPAAAGTILLSHAPARVEEAARAKVGLMLSGHTHDGQLWPFGYLVRTQFPHLAGRYEVSGMTLIVCRGTGTFGPRMRLWYPLEILRVTLRAEGGAPAMTPRARQ